MKSIDIFYQGDGITAVEHIAIGADKRFADLKLLIAETHGIDGEVLLFLEDEEDAVDEELLVIEKAGRAGVKAHVHRECIAFTRKAEAGAE
jgi:hypothetical protein